MNKYIISFLLFCLTLTFATFSSAALITKTTKKNEFSLSINPGNFILFTAKWRSDELEKGFFRLSAVRQFDETDDKPPNTILLDIFNTDVKLDITDDTLTSRTFTSPNKFWEVTLLKFIFDENIVITSTDKLQAIEIKATMQHIVAPHPGDKNKGDKEKGNVKKTGKLRISTISENTLFKGIKSPSRVAHPKTHNDFYLYDLTGSIHPGAGGIRRFTDFTFDFEGKHRIKKFGVDEPATIYVLGIGLLGLIFTRLK